MRDRKFEKLVIKSHKKPGWIKKALKLKRAERKAKAGRVSFLDANIDGDFVSFQGGAYHVKALQNRRDGHCIYDVEIHKTTTGTVYGVGWSEKEKYGHGSEDANFMYDNEAAFEKEWGLK